MEPSISKERTLFKVDKTCTASIQMANDWLR